MVKATLPMAMLPVRAADVVLAATRYPTLRDPDPEAPLVTVIHAAVLTAVQDVPAGFTVTPTVPLPPEAATLTEPGLNE